LPDVNEVEVLFSEAKPKELNEVRHVIAGGMGPRAQDIFQENGINVVLGAMESDPEKAVLSHLKGTLAIGDNVCDH